MITTAFVLGFAIGCILGVVAGALCITYGREQLVGDGAMRGGPTTRVVSTPSPSP